MAISLDVTDGSNITVEVNSGPLNGGIPGAPANSIQFNNGGLFGGIPYTSYANGNLTLGPVGNIKLNGGTPGQVLTTDGAGNLSWTTSVSANVVETFGSGLGFSLSNTIVGNVTTVQFNAPNVLQLRSTLNIGNVANLELGTSTQWLRGDGVWANIPTPTTVPHSNVADTANRVAGSNVVGTVANAQHAALSDAANTAYSVDGGNVVGMVDTANYALFSNVANSVVSISGSNVVGPVAEATLSTTANVALRVAGSNVVGDVAGANYANYAGNALSVSGSNVVGPVSLAALATVSNTALAVAGGNVVGAVANAQHSTIADTANRVAGSNVVGAVALSNVANVSNVALSVDGTNVVGNVASADLSNVANIALSVDGANVVGAVALAGVASVADLANSVVGSNVIGSVPLADLASFADIANSVAGSNVVGVVANANYAAFSNIAAIANSVTAANVIGTVNSANFAFFSQTVTGNLQPNITSVGTLSNLSVSGLSTLSGGVVAPTVTGGSAGLTINSGGVSQSITLAPTSNVITVSDSWIQGVRDPQNAQDAATKNYVDAVATGLFVKQSANCATTAPLPPSTTYTNGVLGIGATLNFTVLDAPVTLDGYTLQNGDRILVKDQIDSEQNGIYIRTNATTWTRSSDGDLATELEYGDFILVVNGIVNSGSGWIQTTTVTNVGTDPVLYNQFSSAGSYTAGTGLQLIGSQFSIASTPVVAGGYGNATHVGSFTVNQQGQIVGASNVPITPFANSLVGSTLSPNVLFSSLTSVGTLSGLQVNGNVTVSNHITAGNITATNIDGQLTDGYQPNIYQLGALANLQVIGEANIGDVSNVVITGGNVGEILTAVDANGNVRWSNSISISGNATVGNLNATGGNLGNAANWRLFGGNNGEVLHTYGNGFLYWANANGGGNTSNTAFQPAIEWIAGSNSTGQSFTHPNVATFLSEEYTSVYVNGALQRQSDYVISGNTLAFTRFLRTGDEITMGSTATTRFTGGTVTSIATTQIDPDNLGFTLQTPGNVPITNAGLITLVVPSASQFSAAIQKKDYVFYQGATVGDGNVAVYPAGTPIRFARLMTQAANSAISYDTATGILSLAGNVPYRLTATVPGTSDQIVFGGLTTTYEWQYANGTPIYANAWVSSSGGGGLGSAYVPPVTNTNTIIFQPNTNVQIKVALSQSCTVRLGAGAPTSTITRMFVEQL